MTKDEALRLALGVMKSRDKWGSSIQEAKDRAIAACEQALEQPEPEPFGYFRYDMRLDAWVQNREGKKPGTPFYTSPPKREPLTDEQLHALFDSPLTPIGLEWARKIEAAHGIKGEKK